MLLSICGYDMIQNSVLVVVFVLALIWSLLYERVRKKRRDTTRAVTTMAEGGPPGINEQKEQISQLLQKSLVKGEAWYLIDIAWMNRWKMYVHFDICFPCHAVNKDLHPGPIDNSGIVKDDDPAQLKDSLKVSDFVLLPQEGWEKISSWYGCVEGQEPIARKVVEHGISLKSCKVELYLTEFKLCEYNDLDHIMTAKFSEGDTIETIEKKIRELFSISEDKETRLWHKNLLSNSYELFDEKTKTVGDALLYQGQLLIIEQKSEDGSWSRQLSETTPDTSNYVENSDPGDSLLSSHELKDYIIEECSSRDEDGFNTPETAAKVDVHCERQNAINALLEEDVRCYLEKETSHNDDEKVIALTIMEKIESSQLEESAQKQLISSILKTKLNMAQYAIDSVFALKEEHELSECLVAVEAVGGDLQRARDYFKECATCYTKFVMDKLVSLFTCQCLVCIECFTLHFSTLAQSTSCMYKFSCPVCNEPVLETCPPEEFQTYFSFLGMTLKMYLTEKDFELYDKKLATWELMTEELFRWCVHGCRSGFINERGDMKIQCPECKQYQCFTCQKPWSKEHEKLTCEQFLIWKKTNDPEYQQQGEVAHLKESGITCPKCKMHYELAKGGCMHFKCPRCLNEFCCGCNLPFRRYPRCQELPSCKGKGLHAHHPRDCLYYLRDEECHALQLLLQTNSIDYSQATNTLTLGAGEGPSQCPVKEQNEGPNGLEDAICGKPIIGQCGLCENHYKEYLVGLINQGNIDPVGVFGLESLQAILRRNDKTIPIRDEDETPSAYCSRLRQVIQLQLPLRPRNSQGVCV